MTLRDIYMLVLAVQQTVDVQDGEDPLEALREAYRLSTGLLVQLHPLVLKEIDEYSS